MEMMQTKEQATRTVENIEKVKELCEVAPFTSVRQVVRKRSMNKGTVHRILKFFLFIFFGRKPKLVSQQPKEMVLDFNFRKK